jgi:hypothetical protein
MITLFQPIAHLAAAPFFVPIATAILFIGLGDALLTVTTEYHLLLLIAGLPLGTGAAAFPQLIALAKGRHFSRFAWEALRLRCTWRFED